MLSMEMEGAFHDLYLVFELPMRRSGINSNLSVEK
jgi:hypothetical protein